LDAEDVVAQIDQQCRQAMTRMSGFPRPEALWSKLPPWEHTPGMINISFILWLYNLARGWGLLAYSRSRYRKLGRDVKWVPGNNAAGVKSHDLKTIAEQAGLQNDELVSMLEEAHRLLGQHQGEGHA
jgi:predicted aldo/keto reductase-like oxidoreductase